MKVLHVVPHLNPSSMSRELDLLLTVEQCLPLELRVCCLGDAGPASVAWRAAAVTVDGLGWRRWLDPRPLWALAARIREFRPDVIHAWGLSALRAVRLAAPKTDASVVVRQPIPSGRKMRGGGSARVLSPWERWLLCGADRILVSSNAERARCAAAGLPAANLRVVPPGVRLLPPARPSHDKPHIVCAGALLPHKGFYEAIWVFDILHFIHRDLELAIIGEGPEHRRLEEFAGRIGQAHSIHLPGQTADIAPWLARAALVLVPSLNDSGAGVALEAMAAGLPVLGYRWPALAEIVSDGATGFLIEPANKMGLAQQTHKLLLDASLRRRLGEEGRRQADAVFSARSFVESWSQVCVEAAA
jgi:glycosyltransferase involved in cell wall biosynthesis